MGVMWFPPISKSVTCFCCFHLKLSRICALISFLHATALFRPLLWILCEVMPALYVLCSDALGERTNTSHIILKGFVYLFISDASLWTFWGQWFYFCSFFKSSVLSPVMVHRFLGNVGHDGRTCQMKSGCEYMYISHIWQVLGVG